MLVHDGLGSDGPDGRPGRPWHHLRRGRPVAQGRMRAGGVVVLPPALDYDLGLFERVEDLAIEQLIAKLAVEALAIAVLPSTAMPSIRARRDGDPRDRRGGCRARCRRSSRRPRRSTHGRPWPR